MWPAPSVREADLGVLWCVVYIWDEVALIREVTRDCEKGLDRATKEG